MTAIALAGIFLGFLADKIGRKKTIIIGLALFAINSYLFLLGNTFGFFLVLLIISGAAIGIFKTGALALIGDMSTSTNDHTSTMNVVEGFFGVGAIIGPFFGKLFFNQKCRLEMAICSGSYFVCCVNYHCFFFKISSY